MKRLSRFVGTEPSVKSTLQTTEWKLVKIIFGSNCRQSHDYQVLLCFLRVTFRESFTWSRAFEGVGIHAAAARRRHFVPHQHTHIKASIRRKSLHDLEVCPHLVFRGELVNANEVDANLRGHVEKRIEERVIEVTHANVDIGADQQAPGIELAFCMSLLWLSASLKLEQRACPTVPSRKARVSRQTSHFSPHLRPDLRSDISDKASPHEVKAATTRCQRHVPLRRGVRVLALITSKDRSRCPLRNGIARHPMMDDEHAIG